MVFKIYKHYNHDADVTEHHTTKQLEEQTEFIKLLVQTPIFQRLKNFLTCKSKFSVMFTVIVIVVHWQKLIDRFLKAIVPVTYNVLALITVISHLTQSTRHC